MSILETLARRLQSLTPDVFCLALDEAGFDEFEKVKVVGACFRTAQKNGWLQRTQFSVKSKRNHSNLHSIWFSDLFGLNRDGTPLAKELIDAEYKKWRNMGFEPPDKLAKFWASQRDLGNSMLFKQ